MGYTTRGLYRLRATGTHQVVRMPPDKDTSPFPVEVDSLVDAGAIQVDGPALTVNAQPDGRWVIATIAGGSSSPAYLTAANVTLTQPWLVYAGLLGFSCPPTGPLGCNFLDTYGEIGPITGWWPGPLCCGGHLVAAPGAGKGSIDLRLSTTPPPGRSHVRSEEAVRPS
jgi:hypothetical protein